MGASQNNNSGLNAAFLMLLKPIARLFLACGRGFREYAELSKAAFVSVASEDYGVRGRPTNRSRIAAMTGLSRKEISRLREKIGAGSAASVERVTPIHDIVRAWQAEVEFGGADGQAAALPLTGGRGSFRSLVRQFAGDIPEGAMRKELQRIGAAEVVDGTIRLLSQDPGIATAEQRLARKLQAGPYPLLAAIAANPLCGEEESSRPCTAVSRARIRRSDVAEVRQQVAQRLRLASRQFVDLLHAYEVQSASGGDEATVSISAGVFYSESLGDDDT